VAKYWVSPAAERDLENIVEHTLRSWGIEQVERYLDVLFAAFERLSRSPRTAPACNHIKSGYRRLRVQRHMIYFRITDYGIAIIRVLHDRMDAPRHL